MVPLEPNKVTPESDSDDHSDQDMSTIMQYFPPQPSNQQQADLELDKPHFEKDAENLVKVEQQKAQHQKLPHRRSQGLSLRTKATALAIAIGVLPVLALGTINYFLSSKDIREDAIASQQKSAIVIGEDISRTISERYGDIQLLASDPDLASFIVEQGNSPQELEQKLNGYIETRKIYDSIIVFDLKGNAIAQSKSAKPFKGNYSNRKNYQEAIRTQKVVINKPLLTKTTGKISVEMAAPIKELDSGNLVGVVLTRMPVEVLDKLLRVEDSELKDSGSTQAENWHLIDPDGKIFAAEEGNQILGEDVRLAIPVFAQLEAAKKAATVEGFDVSDPDQQLVTYAPIEEMEGMPKLNWSVLVHEDTAVVFAAQRQLLLTLLLGTGLTALLVSAIAAYLANRATRPILAASKAVEKLGQGELDTRIAVKGEDELAVLGSNINQMASKLQTALQIQTEQSRRKERYDKQAQLYADVASYRVSQFQDLDPVYNQAIAGAREILRTDRVVVYRFNPDKSGYVAAESVAPGWPRSLDASFPDPCFIEGNYVERYRTGRVKATDNIYEAGLSECYIQQLEPFAVKANLVAPILRNEQLFGLLIAHQCSEPRAWQKYEISFLTDLASQVGLAIDRVDSLEQQRLAKEQLQKRALELLMEVDPLSKGDLTIRATVTDDEIGTVADSYNSTINSLRKIVTQVQEAAKQVTATTSSSEVSVQELSVEALRQTQEITVALDQLQKMSNSIRAVAANAEQAEAAVQLSTQTVEAGDAAMNRTVEGIGVIRETVAQTSIKVKRLGESSQKISKVVKLISSFADQTNLLALNAAIEAARAGEQGLGFAVVADEVQALALQSAEATAEIESLVMEIQTETTEVIAAMESGTKQVAEGTRLVDETRQSLNQITAVSNKISALVQAIASATVTQSQASDSVTHTMTDVAAIANQTSTEAKQVSASFKEQLAVAQELQASAGQFKVT